MRVITLASSSSGNATLVSQGDTHILIDIGISYKRVAISLAALGLTPVDLSGVLVTHDHSDHIGGLKTLTKRHRTEVFASNIAMPAISNALDGLDPKLSQFRANEPFTVGDIEVRAFSTLHDAPGSVGYRLTASGKILAFATDLGRVTKDVLDGTLGADFAIIEAEYDVDMLRYGDYPYHVKQRILSEHGHLSNEASGKFAAALADSGTERILLAHLSRNNNTPRLALETVSRELEADFALETAPADCIGTEYTL
ncbi:MAG: MBL fold metallo-hydrolase [Oscillospiraceae bacterium]|jgi:phosphoribosyl 1,2-cyclic phosphodiesterase|nr:MBL fold metallo-hydrolase [Oscillospiraceae bacterium]